MTDAGLEKPTLSKTGASKAVPGGIPDRLDTPAARLLRSWELLLLAVAIGIFIANSFASPYFLNAWNLSDATFNFTEKGDDRLCHGAADHLR